MMKRINLLTALAVFGLFLGLNVGANAVTCGQPNEVAGGGEGTSLGWDVGSGQCNGDFTVTNDPSFPSNGAGIELGMRAEQRRIGQVPNNAGDYEVQTGDDPGTSGTRAWWNFQHSIAYDGNIGNLDSLKFVIRTDAGSSVPASPVDMLPIRSPGNRPNTANALKAHRRRDRVAGFWGG